MSNDDERIRQLYRDMKDDELLARLRKGDITDAAMAVGLDELARRDVGSDVIATIREGADKAKQKRSKKLWLWWLLVVPLFLLVKALLKQFSHM
jgi:hypothetical protein